MKTILHRNLYRKILKKTFLILLVVLFVYNHPSHVNAYEEKISTDISVRVDQSEIEKVKLSVTNPKEGVLVTDFFDKQQKIKISEKDTMAELTKDINITDTVIPFSHSEQQPVQELQSVPENTTMDTNPASPYTSQKNQNKDQLQIQTQVDQSTGALVYSYPLIIPPGRQNMQPELLLTYNSNQAKIDSLFGNGWNMSIPYISRVQKYGSDKIYDTQYEVFISSLDGELVLDNSNTHTYRPKKDSGNFRIYKYVDNVWSFTDKVGTVYTFGDTPASRQDNPNNQNQIFKWMISSVQDTHTNSILYSYFKIDGQIYPETINYTIHGQDVGLFTISFDTEDRTSFFSSYNTGFEVITKKRISEINITVAQAWVKKYVLLYIKGDNEKDSLLESIQEIARDEISLNEVSKPKTLFEYGSTEHNWELSETYMIPTYNNAEVTTGNTTSELCFSSITHSETCRTVINPMNPPAIASMIRTKARIIDINGDGLQDLVFAPGYYSPSMPDFGPAFYGWSPALSNLDLKGKVWLNTGTNWVYEPSFEIPTSTMDSSNTELCLFEDNNVCSNGSQKSGYLLDINGDGLQDIVYAPGMYQTDGTNSSNTPLKGKVWLNTGINWAHAPSFEIPRNQSFGISSAFPIYTTASETEFLMTPNKGTSVCNLEFNHVGASYASSFFSCAFFTDINGDALPDVVYAPGAYSAIDVNYYQPWVWNNPVVKGKVYINTGTNWVYTPSFEIPTQNGVAIAGWNWNLGTPQPIELCISNRGQICEHRRLTADLYDVNNDGLQDIVYAEGDYYLSRVMLNTGTNWVHAPSFQIPNINTNSTSSRIQLTSTFSLNQGLFNTNANLIDLNNDGLLDISYNPGGTTFMYLNTGTHWVLIDSPASLPSIPIYEDLCIFYENSCTFNSGPMNNYGGLTGINQSRYMDVNNDGFQDILYADGQYRIRYDGTQEYETYKGKVYLGDGQQWNQNGNYSIPNEFNINLNTLVGNNTTGSHVHELCLSSNICPPDDNNSAQIIDINGDMLPDIIHGSGSYRSTPTDVQNINYKGKVWLNTGDKFTNYLKKVTHSQGGITAITYKNTTLKNMGGRPYAVVDTVIQTDPQTNVSLKTAYTYTSGEYFYENLYQKEFVGFEKVEEKLFNNTDNTYLRKTITYFHQGDIDSIYPISNTSLATIGESNDTKYKIGKPFRTEVYDNQDTLYQVTITKWETDQISNNSTFVFQSKEISRLFNGTNQSQDIASEYIYDTTNGNLLEYTTYGEVVAQNDGIFMDTQNDLYKTIYSYATDTTNQIFAPSKVALLNQSNNIEKETKYLYDNQPLGSLLIGDITTEQVWIEQNTYANTHHIYNQYGNKIQTTDPNGNNTTYVYDTYHLYPLTMTQPLNMVTSYTYDYSSGKNRTVTDVNNKIYTQNYDGFDRLVSEYVPDSTTGVSVLKTSIEYVDILNDISTKTTKYLSDSNGVDMYSYFDGFNRMIQTSIESQNGYNTSHTKYTPEGKVYQVSLPYNTISFTKVVPPEINYLYTTYTYDPLSRVQSETNILGVISHIYSGFSDTVIDLNGNKKIYTQDAYGNLKSVSEKNNGIFYTTSYSYNGLKNLTSITDALNNVRYFTYDGRGLQTSAQDLHSVSDTTFGVYVYQYDLNGNVIQKTFSNNQSIFYTYNELNQQISENSTTTLTPTDISYAYNTCANGKGKLCSVNRSNVVIQYTYTPIGLVKDEITTLDNTYTFTTSYTYDRSGNTTRIIYPDGTHAVYTYNTGGLVNSVAYKLPTLRPTYPLLTNITYTPQNNINTITRANGVTTTYTYNPAQMYRLTQMISQKTLEPRIQDVSFTYDSVGNITTLIDNTLSATKKNVIYMYDDLYRLIHTQANYQTKYTYDENYTYNPIGNILSKGNTVYQYGNSQYTNPHAPTAVGATALLYDTNGNLLSFGTQSNIWSYRNELTQITQNSKLYKYTYDHTGQRVKEINDGVTKYTPNKYYTKTGNTLIKYLYLGDTLIGTIDNTVVTYPHVNHLGSVEKITSTTGSVVETTDYYPFGKEVLHSGTNSQRRFIGERYDSSTGLNYLNARYYDGDRGQFLSQDPVFWEIAQTKDGNVILQNPQAQNSYSYALNNPIINKDATGRLSTEAVLNKPVSSFLYAVGWKLFSAGFTVFNKPFAGKLMEHSASFEPGDVHINLDNQKQYGNPIDKIQNTNQYKSYINQTIENAKNGIIKNSGDFEFEGRNDLYYSLHGANIESQVTQENGAWVVNSTVTDRYDFNQTNPQTYKGTLVKIPASQAYKDQDKGVLSNYNVNIQIIDKIKK